MVYAGCFFLGMVFMAVVIVIYFIAMEGRGIEERKLDENNH